MRQIEWIYDQLQSLSTETLVLIINELELKYKIPDDEYKKMALSVLYSAQSGNNITHKQKRVLVNIIGQPN